MSCGELSGPSGELAALRGVRTTVASGPGDLALLARVRRETYVGPWLPDPLIEEAGGEPGSQVELEDSLSQAFLVMLERLTATERAALLLRDVFDYDYREIAEVINRSQATCRQLVSRARKHLRSNGPRFDADVGLRDRLLEQFLAAAEEGDLDALEALLTEDAVLYSDGGGKAIAARRPIFGGPRIARLMAGVTLKQRRRGPLALQLVHVNGQPGRILRTPDGRVWEVLSIDVVGGRIQTVRIVRNPDKLAKRVIDMRRGRKLFETTGRGTRRRHDLPLVYVRGGDDLVALAANADADPTPAWWLNLRTAGEVGTVVKGHQRVVAPSVVEGTRRDRVWRRFRAASPVEYRRGRTTRRLPVVGVDRERRPDGPITYFDERELSTR